MVVVYALALAAGGVVVGAMAGVVASRLVAGLLFRVSATDPMTYVSIAGLLVATAVVAAFTPAARAARVDPMLALRGD
jgi:putative ABC transport system permease protein